MVLKRRSGAALSLLMIHSHKHTLQVFICKDYLSVFGGWTVPADLDVGCCGPVLCLKTVLHVRVCFEAVVTDAIKMRTAAPLKEQTFFLMLN